MVAALAGHNCPVTCYISHTSHLTVCISQYVSHGFTGDAVAVRGVPPESAGAGDAHRRPHVHPVHPLRQAEGVHSDAAARRIPSENR